MRYGFDYNQASGNSFDIVTKSTGDDKAKARDGARRASIKHGTAAMLFYQPDSDEPCGAVTYVDGRMSSRDGVTLKQAIAA